MKKSIVAGFICAMLGICLITFQKGEKLELNPVGDFLGLAAAAIWGVYSVCTRKIGGFGYDLSLIHILAARMWYAQGPD